MARLTLLAAAVVGACLVLAATDHAETPTPTSEPPVAEETAVAPPPVETAIAPVDETPAADEEPPTADEETPAADEEERPEEPLPPDTADEESVIAPAPDEESVIAPAEEQVIAPPRSGAGSPSGGSWPWWPLAVAGAAAGAAGVLLAYQGRRAKS
jgi:hypothetical protein